MFLHPLYKIYNMKFLTSKYLPVISILFFFVPLVGLGLGRTHSVTSPLA